MGLGNLNPGCGCRCGPPPFVPTNLCQEAGVFWKPISVTVSTPVFGGLPLYQCGAAPWPTCGRLSPNPARVTTPFLPVSHPNFDCQAVARSYADYGTGDGQINCYGIWKIYEGTQSAFLINSRSWNVIGPPYSARADGAIGKTFTSFPYRYFFSIRVGVTVQFIMNGSATADLGAWATNQTQGVNWYRSYNNVSVGGMVRESQYRSTDGKSVFDLTYILSLPGSSGLQPPWCGGGPWWFVQLSSTTFFQAFEDDPPSIRGTREVEIWSPDPALDMLGLTSGAMGVISLGTQ